MSTVAHPYIERRADGLDYITGTQVKVVEIALDRLAYNWDADEIHRQHPHLTLPQIYSALAHYYDNESYFNDLIAQREARAQEILAALPPSPIRSKLLAAKQAKR
jgi:uncharacterized protein (DUF433 family)